MEIISNLEWLLNAKFHRITFCIVQSMLTWYSYVTVGWVNKDEHSICADMRCLAMRRTPFHRIQMYAACILPFWKQECQRETNRRSENGRVGSHKRRSLTTSARGARGGGMQWAFLGPKFHQCFASSIFNDYHQRLALRHVNLSNYFLILFWCGHHQIWKTRCSGAKWRSELWPQCFDRLIGRCISCTLMLVLVQQVALASEAILKQSWQLFLLCEKVRDSCTFPAIISPFGWCLDTALTMRMISPPYLVCTMSMRQEWRSTRHLKAATSCEGGNYGNRRYGGAQKIIQTWWFCTGKSMF